MPLGLVEGVRALQALRHFLGAAPVDVTEAGEGGREIRFAGQRLTQITLGLVQRAGLRAGVTHAVVDHRVERVQPQRAFINGAGATEVAGAILAFAQRQKKDSARVALPTDFSTVACRESCRLAKASSR